LFDEPPDAYGQTRVFVRGPRRYGVPTPIRHPRVPTTRASLGSFAGIRLQTRDLRGDSLEDFFSGSPNADIHEESVI
jgi:hypothetical protein